MKIKHFQGGAISPSAQGLLWHRMVEKLTKDSVQVHHQHGQSPPHLWKKGTSTASSWDTRTPLSFFFLVPMVMDRNYNLWPFLRRRSCQRKIFKVESFLRSIKRVGWTSKKWRSGIRVSYKETGVFFSPLLYCLCWSVSNYAHLTTSMKNQVKKN